MAIKIKLGTRPKSFPRTVVFPMLEGPDGQIEMSFKYRTREEFGTFVDALVEAAGITATPGDEKFSMAKMLGKTSAANADYVLQIADGWNLDEPFTREAIEQLGNEIPAAVLAIMEDYRSAITEGRKGN